MTAPLPAEKKRVLIVDDSQSIRTLFKLYFKRLPVQLEFAEDGLEAIELLRKNRPDLILLDIMMPRMSGSELLDFLNAHEDTRHIPRIVITALSDFESRHKPHRQGVTAFVPKPVAMETLRPLVQQALESGRFPEPSPTEA